MLYNLECTETGNSLLLFHTKNYSTNIFQSIVKSIKFEDSTRQITEISEILCKSYGFSIVVSTQI